MNNKIFHTTVDYTNEVVIDKFLNVLEQIKSDSKDKSWAFNLPEPLRSKLLYTLGQNSYGFRHQNLLIYESAGFIEGVPSTLSRGDFKIKDIDKYFEFKASYTSKVGTYSFWQARLWQKLDGYVFKTINRLDNFSIQYFGLTKEQIVNESVIQDTKPTHGDKEVAKENTHVEVTFRYDPSNEFQKDRWEGEYLRGDIFKWIASL